MKQRLPLLVGLALFLPAVASAALSIVPIPKGPPGAGPATNAAFCTVGVSGPAVWAVEGYLQAHDTYYTRIDPQSCGCSTGGLITTAHVNLYIPTDYANVTATVSIVGSEVTGPGCVRPVPSEVLCHPVTSAVLVGSGAQDLAFSLGDSCCVDRTAFLVVTIESIQGQVDLVTDGSCGPCISWQATTGGLVDLCSQEVGLPGNPMMFVDVQCCWPVGVRPDSWGKLKTLYR